MIKMYNTDCMELMSKYENNHFDIAIVDPPYGNVASRGRSMGTLMAQEKKYKSDFEVKPWLYDAPEESYFKELFRVSKNQIIWGGNYFNLPTPYRCGIIWDKMIGDSSFAAGELAWSSFDKPLRIFRYSNHSDRSEKIHPTQKPIKLYEWLLKKNNFVKKGDKILDTHLGSGSIAIACHNQGFSLTCCEIDKDYFLKAASRYHDHIAQLSLFA